MEKVVDANIIIRYLIEDDKQKVNKIEKLLRSNTGLILTDVTISEIVWVLSSYYGQTRKKISQSLTSLLSLGNIKSNKKLLLKAFFYYGKYNVDWIDAYLAAHAEENNLKEIYSYDKDLDKIKSVKRLEP